MTSWNNNNVPESKRLAEEVLDPAKKSRKIKVEHLYQLKKN